MKASKNRWMLFVVAFFMLASIDVKAQEEDPEESSGFSTGVDVYTNYIWRGTKLGTGPSVQPGIEFTAGGFTIGVWGDFDASGYSEVDPYISYSFPFGLTLGVSDYYFPSQQLFDFSDTTGSHAIELSALFEIGGLSLSANIIPNKAPGAGSTGGDLYFEAGYSFKSFNVFLGAGDGWLTTDGAFNVCNIGIGTTKEIKITDTFSVPVNGQFVVNPELEQMMIVVGFSL